MGVLAITAFGGACSSDGHGVKTGGGANYAQQYEADARPVQFATTDFLKHQGSAVSPSLRVPSRTFD